LEQQLVLSQSWDQLLLRVDSMQLDKQTRYIDTYFIQPNRDQFIGIAVLEYSSKYYGLVFRTLEGKGEIYIMDVKDRLIGNESITQLVEDYFYSDNPLEFNPDEDTSSITYSYKPYFGNEIKDTTIPSCKPLADKISFFIEDVKPYETISDIFTNGDHGMKDSWNNLLLSLQNKKNNDTSLRQSAFYSRIPSADSDLYNAILEYRFRDKNENFTFVCIAILVDGKWKIKEITPLVSEQMPFGF